MDTKKLNYLFGSSVVIEGGVLLSLLKEPDLISDYPLIESDFKLEESKQLLKLIKLCERKDFNTIDSVAIDVIFSENNDLKEFFAEYGGSRQIVKNMNNINSKNIDTFYDNLMKRNYLLFLNEKGFDLERYAEKISEMEYEDVKDWVEMQFINGDNNNNRSMRKVEFNELELSDDLFDEIVAGEFIETLSFNKYAPLLNNAMNGIVLGGTTILAGLSGSSKSTFIISNMIMPIISESEETVTLISNELGFKSYMMMLIPMVAYREFNFHTLTRDKLMKGKLSDDEIAMMRKVQVHINKNLKHKIHFINVNDSNINVIKKSMKRNAKLGCKLFIIDTFKASDSSTSNAWATVLEDMKELTYLSQELNVALVCAYQVAQSAFNKRKINRSDLAEAKNIATMANAIFMLRHLKADEYDGKYEVKVYHRVRNPQTGKWEKQYKKLDPNKRYIVGYLDKCRFSEDGTFIVYEFMGHIACYREIGWAEVCEDYGYKG